MAQDTAAEEQLDLLRRVMLRWSEGTSPRPEEVRAVFVADRDPRAKRDTECTQRVEEELGVYLAEHRPSLLLPLAFWQMQMLFGAIEWTESTYLHTVDIERVHDRLEEYHHQLTRGSGARSPEQADRNAVLAWVGVAALMAQPGTPEFTLRAEAAIQRAIEIDRDATVARYWSAWLSERLPKQPVDRMRPWRELAQAHPDRPEYRLRYGLAARRAARDSAAREALESVARGDGESWMRIVAYEEWVQSLLAGKSEDQQAARDILDEARQAFPHRPGLDLLAAFMGLESRPKEALELAEQVEAHKWGREETSPRLRLEFPSENEVGAARRDLVELLTAGREDLAAELQTLDPGRVLSARSRKACGRRDKS